MSHVFFSKDVMDKPAYTGAYMRFRYCLRTGSWQFGGGSVMIWAAISYTRRTNIMCVQGNLTAQRYRYDILQPDMAQCF